nr:LOW QUALITY PROTEIN: CD2 antigen cytoplasmic tail-binding protein 2-like [Rhipicephalus microplus]
MTTSSKRVQFDEMEDELLGKEGVDEGVKKKFKNSLDSDEEDDEVEDKKYNLLNPDDVEGQEDKTIEYDGNIKITPFNMEDEMEDGHFDKDGMFIFNRDKPEIRDNWLDNIDWVKVRPTKQVVEDSRGTEDSEDEERVDALALYGDMLEIMQPGETVLSCIKRLGGGKRDSTINRWKKKKQEATEPDSTKDVAPKETLLRMTELADRLVSTGDMDIYQQTYERLKFLREHKQQAKEAKAATTAVEGSSFDMFADDADSTKATEPSPAQDEKAAAESKSEDAEPVSSSVAEDEVMWEFKWEESDDAPVYGLHTSAQMLQWVQEGYFQDGVWVRKAHETDRPFYSSRRIDFELYV